MFWLAYDDKGKRYIVIQPSGNLITARLVTAVANLDGGEFVEGHLLDDKIARRIPKNMLGKRLTGSAALRLLKKLA